MPRTVRIAAISCTHAPFTPPSTMKWVCETISSLKAVDWFVHLGDLFEAGAASVHASSAEYSHTLEDEYQFGHNLLKSIRECLPKKCRFVCHLGNHDDNILTQDPRRVPSQLRSLVDWRKHERYGAEFKKWHWKPYVKGRDGVSSFGQVRLVHGFDAGANSDELEGLQIANLFPGVSNQLVVRGHTHRPMDVTQMRRTARIPLPFWYANVGTAGPLQPNWMMRKDTSQWGTAIAVIDAVIDYKAEGGRQWEARVLKMPID